MAEFRKKLRGVKRIVIKVGTGVVSNPNGLVALGRLSHIVEQIDFLHRSGCQIVLVSSGAVGLGKLKLRRRRLVSTTLHQQAYGVTNSGPDDSSARSDALARARAAAGQSELLALYERLFTQLDQSVSQLLLLDSDFTVARRRATLVATLQQLLECGVIPVINENDAVSPRTTPVRDSERKVFWDNDSLASLIARAVDADLLILLSDVEGFLSAPPGSPSSRVVHTFRKGIPVNIGTKSVVGRGGMKAKIDAALSAVENGVSYCVIASGFRTNVILDICRGKLIGTLFADHLPPVDENEVTTEDQAQAVKHAAQQLVGLSSKERSKMIRACADALLEHADVILEANKQDIELAYESELEPALMARLELTPAKLKTLAQGMKQVADMKEPLHEILRHSELSNGLELQQVTAPLGVLLVIFESRPGVLAQVSALALKTGNGLILKGGSEASNSNLVIHRVLTQAIEDSTQKKVPGQVVTLVEGRAAVAELLRLNHLIDLVIPRGSNTLVSHIQRSTHIPVLGHADGVCHVYVDVEADLKKAFRICVDSKTDYPAACNAVETLLIHEKLVANGHAQKLLDELVKNKVELIGFGKAAGIFEITPTTVPKKEHGNLTITVVIVKDMLNAVDFINMHGSGHTDCVVTENKKLAEQFLAAVNSACVFWNASTRFADGFRFGLGCEVGISTGKVHARGPVGVQGLLTTKWILRSTSDHVVKDFSSGKLNFTHKLIPIPSRL